MQTLVYALMSFLVSLISKDFWNFIKNAKLIPYVQLIIVGFGLTIIINLIWKARIESKIFK